MSQINLDELQKIIEKEINREINYTERENEKADLERNITKVQRREKWPEPPDPEEEFGDN